MSELMIKAIAASNQPEATFAALEKLVDETIGVKLFTLMEIDRVRNVARRNYSNMPEAYPASGEKPRVPNRWSEHVEEQHKTFVANTIEEIAGVFPDYELIQSLGCESCLNLPIVVADQVIGTLNCLHDSGHYTEERIKAAESLKPAGALAFLIANHLKQGA